MKNLLITLIIFIITSQIVFSDVNLSSGNGNLYLQTDEQITITNTSLNANFQMSYGGKDYIPNTKFSPLGGVQVLNMALIDAGLVGFVGSFTDGKYGYCLPYNGTASKIGRFDLNNFTTSGVGVLNLALVDTQLTGPHGGFTDGKYGYIMPYNGGSGAGKIARVDLQNFTTSGVSILNLTNIGNPNLLGYYGGFTDGKFGYCIPFYNPQISASHGNLVRFDLNNFTTNGINVINLTNISTNLSGFAGGFTDGKFGYLIPFIKNSVYHGNLVRFDLNNFTTSGISVLNLASINAGYIGFTYGFTDGKYGYCIPYRSASGVYHGNLVRFDLNNFTTSGISVLNLASIDSQLSGFNGGYISGHYAYLSPAQYTKVARIDLNNFTTNGVSILNLTSWDATLTGLSGFGFSDNTYGYILPYSNGKVSRFLLTP